MARTVLVFLEFAKIIRKINLQVGAYKWNLYVFQNAASEVLVQDDDFTNFLHSFNWTDAEQGRQKELLTVNWVMEHHAGFGWITRVLYGTGSKNSSDENCSEQQIPSEKAELKHGDNNDDNEIKQHHTGLEKPKNEGLVQQEVEEAGQDLLKQWRTFSF
ncbi:unnamed protein product [Gongylonema pulchrum]|uniref:DUF4283 domain-containing protein n=1 Tax=Gongylonema pulchrum TaxID=637853 RepID=A0A183CXA5_9BILA|nr:unnamed protein product [Gongylonema pulchrum]